MHYAICETYVVKWSSMDLWSIGGECRVQSVMKIIWCICFTEGLFVLHTKDLIMGCNSVAWMYGQLVGEV